MNGRGWILACAVLAAGGSAQAAITCAISSSSGLAFGTVDLLSGSTPATTGSITVSCTGGYSGTGSYTVAINAGSYGTVSARQMGAGTARLNYNIYTTTGGATVWGDGTSGSVTQSGSYSSACLWSGCASTFTLYGRIGSGQSGATAGAYSSTLTLTVTYT